MPQDKKSPLDMFLQQQEDCDRPACEDTVNALSSALNRLNKKKEASSESIDKGISSSKMCPPTKDVIGSSSWTLLHSMAAWYPEKPSDDEKLKMGNFMEALSIFYPCTYCATDFQENLKKTPVKADSRKDLCIWLCEQHNLVNEKLDKNQFKCEMKNLDERWRKSSDPSCNR